MNAAAKKTYFTVAEANRRLPLVRVIVQDIVALHRDVTERKERLEHIRQLPGATHRDEENVYGEEVRQIEDDLEKDVAQLEAFAAELHELGAELKDPSIGLVDFPTIIDGHEALLCWKLGEDEIGFWHGLEDGFRGRRSLMQPSATDEPAEADET